MTCDHWHRRWRAHLRLTGRSRAARKTTSQWPDWLIADPRERCPIVVSLSVGRNRRRRDANNDLSWPWYCSCAEVRMRRHASRPLIAALFMLLLALPMRGAGGQASPAVPPSALWEAPTDLHARNLFDGPWGEQNAPDPRATYQFMRFKSRGVNPGVVVRDRRGRVWHVKQARDGRRGAEGPVEVVVSRVLSAVGYHQPPVYFLPSFTMEDESGTHLEAGGRFRPDVASLEERGHWSLQKNPFVGTRPHQGLLVILLMFNSWDLKASNNTLYAVHRGDRIDEWYVVRDLGGALGASGIFATKRNNLEEFERQRWIRKVENGFVEFRYGGRHPELMRRISVEDLRWACELVGRLTEQQWQDAFRAGGYPADVARRFIHKLRGNIEEGRRAADGEWPLSPHRSSRD